MESSSSSGKIRRALDPLGSRLRADIEVSKPCTRDKGGCTRPWFAGITVVLFIRKHVGKSMEHSWKQGGERKRMSLG